jgi:hypothetical protein
MVEQSLKDIPSYIQSNFYTSYLEGLKEFIRIPSLSPIFDPDWKTNRNLFKQCTHLINWAKS